MSIIGDNIKKFRLFEGLTQKDLAEYLGVSQTVVGFWENGRNDPKDDKIKQLANLFDITPSELRGESESDYTNLVQQMTDDFPVKVLLLSFNLLNHEGKTKVMEYINDLLCNPQNTISEDIAKVDEKLKSYKELEEYIFKNTLQNKDK